MLLFQGKNKKKLNEGWKRKQRAVSSLMAEKLHTRQRP
jgi:hypothetical protein